MIRNLKNRSSQKMSNNKTLYNSSLIMKLVKFKKVKEAKELLEKTNFRMTRLDILYEENQRLFTNEK